MEKNRVSCKSNGKLKFGNKDKKKNSDKKNDDSKLEERVVFLNRVTKVVKGGRIFRFSALVAVGDGKGHVGLGLGKASETNEAIRKGKENAKKNLIFVERNNNESIYHDIVGKFGSSKVLIKPATEGTGVIAGGPVRIIMELVGIKNVRSKSLGSRNRHNVTKAVIDGLKNLKSPKEILKLRMNSAETQ